MPTVMPFYHRVPKTGKTIRCIVGEKIEFGDLVDLHESNRHNRLAYDYPNESDLLIALTNRIFSRMAQLDQRLIEIEKTEAQAEGTDVKEGKMLVSKEQAQ